MDLINFNNQEFQWQEILLSFVLQQKKIIVVEDLSDFIRQIIKIGTNVNQVALVANTYRTVSVKQIETLNENLIAIQQLMRRLLTVIKNTGDEIKV